MIARRLRVISHPFRVYRYTPPHRNELLEGHSAFVPRVCHLPYARMPVGTRLVACLERRSLPVLYRTVVSRGFLLASESVGSLNQPETLEKGKQWQGKTQSRSSATRQLVGHHSTTKSDAITGHYLCERSLVSLLDHGTNPLVWWSNVLSPKCRYYY
jgi:hypothetical protein